jgi:predicted MFS family arabinose efflux permease
MAAIVLLFVREPARGGLDATRTAVTRPAPGGFWSTCRMFFSHPVLLRLSLACAATQIVTYAVLNFTTLFLMREKGMTLQEIAIYYAILIGAGMGLGMYVSGRLIDRLARRSKTAYGYLPAIALAFLVLPTFLNYFYLSPAVTLVQEEVQPDQRVLAGALLLLVMNLIGLGFGPTWLGAVSDLLRPSHPDNSLQLAFYTLVPFYLLAVLLHLWLARALKRQSEAK